MASKKTKKEEVSTKVPEKKPKSRAKSKTSKPKTESEKKGKLTVSQRERDEIDAVVDALWAFVGKIKDERKIIDLETEKFSKVIGFSITGIEIKKILSSLGCFIRISGKKMKVLPPTWRPDIKEDIETKHK